MKWPYASVIIFSGRPDPKWKINEDLIERLEDLWRVLDEYNEPPPTAPSLGYRGCSIRINQDTEYFANKGIVTKSTRAVRVNRVDTSRLLERMVLTNVPKGLLPGDLIHQILSEL